MQQKDSIFVPDYITELAPYKPGKSSDPDSFSRYKAIICSNENNFGPSPRAIQAIREAADKIHQYPDPQSEKLVNKLVDKHDRKFDEFLLSNGLDGLLYSLFKAFTVPGDHVIASDNSFIAYNKFAKMHNLNLEKVPMLDGFQFNLDGMLAAVKEETRVVYLCNPNNPTGSSITEEDLKAFVNNVPKSTLVVIDEAYFDFARELDHTFPDSASWNISNVLTLRTFSKLYGLAGVRIGYGIGDSKVIEALNKVNLVFNPNILAQIGAVAALDDVYHIQRTVRNNVKWMKELEKILKDKGIEYIGSKANFITTVFPSNEEASNFNKIMDEAGILLRKLDGFGIPNAVRISIGNEEEMEYVTEVLREFE